MPSRWKSIAGFATAAAAVSLLAAGCGGGSSPSVADLPSTGTNTTLTTAGSGGLGGSAPGAPSNGGSGVQGFEMAMRLGPDGPKFSACMRAHRVPNFPDPNSQGLIQIGSNSGIDPRSPSFKRARQACQKLLPNGGKPTPQQTAETQHAMLTFAACMRRHGVKDFPDPALSAGGGVSFSLRAQPGSDLNPRSPIFQRAQQACRGALPGIPAAAGSPSGSAK